MHYCADVNMAFTSVVHITGDVNYHCFILRYLHANWPLFFRLYLHIGRGIYYGSYTKIVV